MSELHEAAATSRPTAAQPKTRRRNRIITSCLECRRRKLKCDKKYPCDHCHKGSRDCVFLAPARDPASQSRINQLKDSIERIEKGLEAGIEDAEDTNWVISAASTKPSIVAKVEGQPSQPADELLEPSPLAVDAVAYEDDDDDDILDDLGVQLGKMRVTERIGGAVRPMFSFEIADVMRRNSGVEPNTTYNNWTDNVTPEQFLAPSEGYLAPGIGMLFPSMLGDNSSVMTFLPSRQIANSLIQQYWIRVHPLARVVHRPSFERQYLRFWQAITTGFEPTFSVQAVVFAALLSAAVSMTDLAIFTLLGRQKEDLVKALQAGIEYALSRANVMRTTKTETLQAFTMYLLVICRKEISRAHAAVTSMAVRLAMMAGLHKDGIGFGLPPVETHVRRLIWYQLLKLENRTNQAVGPTVSHIRAGEYDTKLPLNVDDNDLEGLLAPMKDADRWTDNTLNRMRAEIMIFSADLFMDKQRIDKRQTVISATLKRVDEWAKRMEAKWVPLIDESVAEQELGLKLMRLHHSGFYIGLLHRYVVSAPNVMPQRLVDLVWSAAVTNTELSMIIETDPRFEPYRWFTGMFQNWHTALLLFAELVRSKPDRPGADRAWKVMDYVFELPPHLSPVEKTMLLALQARGRMGEYERRRRRRLPVELQRSLGVTHRYSVPNPGHESLSPPHAASPPAVSQSMGIYGAPLHHAQSYSEVPNLSSDMYRGPQDTSGTSESTSGTYNTPDTQNTSVPELYDYNELFPDMTSLQGMDWDEVDRLFQMDTTMDSSTAAPPAFAPPSEPLFDMSALAEMSFDSNIHMPPPLWGRK